MEYKLSDDTWSVEELDAINRVIQSNKFSMGTEVAEYEKRFAEKIGSKYAVMTNSGSSANLIAIASLIYSGRLAAGDEVIVQAVSWSTTFFPLSQYNLKLKFVDIELETLNIDINQIEDAITSKTKAIFCVNLLGNPNDYDKIQDICNKYDLILIEDNCEALGGRHKDRALGTFGLLGTFSTFYSHHLCTMEGGVTVTNDEELYHYMLSIRSHGWTRHLPKDSKIYRKSEDDFYESFNFIMPGYNFRPLEIEAAVGLEQLKKLDSIISKRRENAKYFVNKVKNINGIMIQKEISESSWFGFAMTLCGDKIGKRKELVAVLKQNSIEVRPIVSGNFTKNIAVKYMDYTIHRSLLNADRIHDNGFFVGNHSKENKKEVDMLADILHRELE